MALVLRDTPNTPRRRHRGTEKSGHTQTPCTCHTNTEPSAWYLAGSARPDKMLPIFSGPAEQTHPSLILPRHSSGEPWRGSRGQGPRTLFCSDPGPGWSRLTVRSAEIEVGFLPQSLMYLRPGFPEREARGGCVEDSDGPPDPPFRTETFIPKSLSWNYPQPQKATWVKVTPQT